jgi:SAM-dependent methyltransferase
MMKNTYSGKSLLDVGCGTADLYQYLQRTGANLDKYMGVDIITEVIQKAKEKSLKNASFEVRDIAKQPLPDNSFDYVVEVGIFSLNTDNYYNYVKETLLSMYNSCKIMTMASFPLSEQNEEFIKASRKLVEQICINFITTNYRIEKDKRNNEFVIYLMK